MSTSAGDAALGSLLFRRSLPAVIPGAFALYRRRPWLNLGLALLLQGPVYLVLGLFGPSASLAGSLDACTALAGATASVATGVVSGALYVVLTAAMAAALLLELAGQRVGVSSSLILTTRKLRPLATGTALAGAVVLVLLALPLGALGLIEGCYGGEGAREVVADVRRAADEAGRSAPARAMAWGALLVAVAYVVHAGVKWVVMPQAALVEGGTATRVLWRSRDLVRGRWLGVALVLAGLLLAQAALSVLLALPLLFVSYALPEAQGEPVRAATRALAQVALLPLGALGSTLLYLRLRQEKEGFGPTELFRQAEILLEL